MSDALRVAVLGAAGTIAPAIVRDLSEAEEIESLLLLDLDGGRAASVAREYGGARARACRVDANEGLARMIDGCDLLINSASYRINLVAMGACLEAGCHYLDLGGLYWMTKRQLALSSSFEGAGLLALLGIGSSPGKTNLMAAMGVAELGGGESVDAIHVSAAGRDPKPPPGFALPYALRTLLDELTMRPVAVREGRSEELQPLSPGGAVDFGEPIGKAETIHTLHSEMLTFPTSFGCREASFRLSLPEPLLSRLRELSVAPRAEVEAATRSASRSSPRTVAVHQIDASGPRGSVRVRALTRPVKRWKLGGGVVSTAAPAAAAARLLARGRIDARGVLPPELCIDPAAMFVELEARGTELTIEARQQVAP